MIIFLRNFILVAALFAFNPNSNDYDLLIINGEVFDGTGTPSVKTDIAIVNDEIMAIGQLQGMRAKRVIDATGLYVTPGFIDSHSHAAESLAKKDLSAARPLLAQGITTVIVNPDGGGAIDLIRQQQELSEFGLGVNVAQMVPHGAIRRQVIGMDDRAPDPTELREMKMLIREGMRAGAVGMSTGLFYAPASYSDTAEIIELAKIVHQYNGVHQSHIRDESDYTIGVYNAVQEIIDISEASGVVGIISHIKALGPNVWGKSKEIVKLIDEARDKRGLHIYADQYPYEASATGLMAALVPRWATAGGRQAFLERLDDDETRNSIILEMEENLARRGGAGRISMRHAIFARKIEGSTLHDLAEARSQSPVETALDLLRDGSPGIVSFNMKSDDVEHFMSQHWTITASDGDFVAKDDGVPHPRNYGSFPRKIYEYVIQREVIEMSAAIRSMTSLPASVYRLGDRGVIRKGSKADIVIFNPDKIRDIATFTDPHQLSEGMVYVIVNGVPAIDEERQTGLLNGKILKRIDG
jgi:N-acyl-D-amino-acid deacylase